MVAERMVKKRKDNISNERSKEARKEAVTSLHTVYINIYGMY